MSMDCDGTWKVGRYAKVGAWGGRMLSWL
jgi:hypothetical protein